MKQLLSCFNLRVRMKACKAADLSANSNFFVGFKKNLNYSTYTLYSALFS